MKKIINIILLLFIISWLIYWTTNAIYIDDDIKNIVKDNNITSDMINRNTDFIPLFIARRVFEFSNPNWMYKLLYLPKNAWDDNAYYDATIICFDKYFKKLNHIQNPVIRLAKENYSLFNLLKKEWKITYDLSKKLINKYKKYKYKREKNEISKYSNCKNYLTFFQVDSYWAVSLWQDNDTNYNLYSSLNINFILPQNFIFKVSDYINQYLVNLNKRDENKTYDDTESAKIDAEEALNRFYSWQF